MDYPGDAVLEGNLFQDLSWAVVDSVYGFAGSFTDVRVVNNTFAGNGASYVTSEGVTSDEPKLLFANNLTVNSRREVSTPDGMIATSLHNLSGTDVTEASYGLDTSEGDVVADPIFVAYSDDFDWTNDDFRLVEGSPGIDMGLDGYSVTGLDYDGLPRSEDGDGDGVALPDVGAFETSADNDRDDDGFEGQWGTGADCDDGDAAIHPGADEVCGDLVDQDCDGADLPCPDDTGDTGDGGDQGDGGGEGDGGAAGDSGTSDGGADAGSDGGLAGQDDGSGNGGCGCAAGGGGIGGSWVLWLAGALVMRRRRR